MCDLLWTRVTITFLDLMKWDGKGQSCCHGVGEIGSVYMHACIFALLGFIVVRLGFGFEYSFTEHHGPLKMYMWRWTFCLSGERTKLIKY